MRRVRKGLGILVSRLREQGLTVTVLWFRDHAVRLLTGMSPPGTSRVAPNLYLGGQHYRHGLERMARLGISSTVSLRESSDDRDRGVALQKHLWLPTVDDTSPNVEDLKEASAFIGQAMGEDRGVYVHCLSGVGRAATTVAAYLVTSGLRADEAWVAIRQVRPFVRPNAVQTASVEEFHTRSSLPDGF